MLYYSPFWLHPFFLLFQNSNLLLPPSAFLTWGSLTSPPFFPFSWKIRFSAGTPGPFSQVEHQINHANFLSSPQDGDAPLEKRENTAAH